MISSNTLKIYDEDVGLKTKAYSKETHRTAARAVLINEDNIALLHASKYDYYKLPGGGVEKGESIREALKRECIEETGCTIKIIRKAASTVEYRSKWSLIQTSHCYIAQVKSIGKPKFTKSEKSEGFELLWIPVDKALRFIQKNKPRFYDGKFMVFRDSYLLKEALKVLHNK